MGILVALHFSEMDCQERGAQLILGKCELHRNYGMVVILFYFLCKHDNLTPKLHQEKRSHPVKKWFFIGIFKV